VEGLEQHEVHAAFTDLAVRFDHAVVGDRIGRTAYEQIPQLAHQGDLEVRDEAILAATSNVVAIIDGMLHGRDPLTIEAPSVSLQWAEWLVARGIDVATVPWAYNFGHGEMAGALRDVIVELDIPGEERWALGDGVSRYVRSYVENVCAQMVDHFVSAEERWRGGAVAVRRELVAGIVAGRITDPVAAGSELGYRLDRPHLATVVWTVADPAERPPVDALGRAADQLLRMHGASEVLVVANGLTTVWAWGSGASLSETTSDRPTLAGSGLLAAVGTVSSGLAGFVQSHHDANRAKQMAGLLSRRPGAVVAYRSVALASLIASDPDHALRFLDAELGPLMEDSDANRRLRATLAVYLEEGMRPVRAARRLGVHQNTVAYRIAQAEQAIGRPLTERRLELETALRLAEARDALRSAGRGTTGA
jgi:hypothetical protein